MLRSGDKPSPEFEQDKYFKKQPLSPTEATIEHVYNREEINGETPIYVICDIKHNNGVIQKEVPFAYPYPDERRRPNEGDRVLVVFRQGKAHGAVIVGFLDTAKTKGLSRSTPDMEFKHTSDGSKTRIDQNGNTIIQRTQSMSDFSVDYQSTKDITFATKELESQYQTATDSRLYSLVNQVIAWEKNNGFTGQLFQITSILRDWPTQDRLYGDDPNYRAHPFDSPHMLIPSAALDAITAIKKPEDEERCRQAIGPQFVLFHQVTNGGRRHLHLHVSRTKNNIPVPDKSQYDTT